MRDSVSPVSGIFVSFSLHLQGVSAVLPSTPLSSIQEWSGPSPPLTPPQEACFLRKVQPCQQNPINAGKMLTDDARYNLFNLCGIYMFKKI